MKIMASGPITPWEIDGETVEQCQTFFFGLLLRREKFLTLIIFKLYFVSAKVCFVVSYEVEIIFSFLNII